MSIAFLNAPACLESSNIALLPKPQEHLFVFLYPDETSSTLCCPENTHQIQTFLDVEQGERKVSIDLFIVYIFFTFLTLASPFGVTFLFASWLQSSRGAEGTIPCA